MDPRRPRTIIVEVIREALRSTGHQGVALSGGGPEQALLEEWLGAAGIPCLSPSEAALTQATQLLDAVTGSPAGTPSSAKGREGPSRSGSEREEIPRPAGGPALAGLAQALAGDLLLAGTANKTQLLLSPSRLIQPVFPLGDLHASEIRLLAGRCTLPSCLHGRTELDVEAVDRALVAYYEEGAGEGDAFGDLDSGLRETVLKALAAARRRWQVTPLIPKLRSATLGLDLDP